jgi:hypothetical protein
MPINPTPDSRRIDDKHIVTVVWCHGSLWVPYGIHHFVFDTQSEALTFGRDADSSLRRRSEYNWLYQGHSFWTSRLLVMIAEPGGYARYGWQFFTLSDEEVAKECEARALDVEKCIAERDALRESRDSNISAIWKD